MAALRNNEIGRVLAAVHLDPARHWSVEDLAEIMGASRSSFAQRFLDIVGETPARYVGRTRMQQAHQWLKQGQRVATVAHRLGYESEASFSRAYKRITGAPPVPIACRWHRFLQRISDRGNYAPAMPLPRRIVQSTAIICVELTAFAA